MSLKNHSQLISGLLLLLLFSPVQVFSQDSERRALMSNREIADAVAGGGSFSADGPSMIEIQKALIELGYRLPRFGTDGQIGNETRRAVREFQGEASLPVTGLLDSGTLTAMDAALLPADTPSPPVGGTNDPVTNPLYFKTKAHFMASNVDANLPLSRAIPKHGVITGFEGASLSLQVHPDYPEAELRVIRLPKSIRSKEETARILAESGALQDGDVMLVFRPDWYQYYSYCNVQLGITHAAMVIIQSENGKQYAHSVENPLTYSSRLSYLSHYNKHDLFHIVRPNLTDAQRKNVRAWSQKILDLKKKPNPKSHLDFFGDYGKPYNAREGVENSLPFDLAMALTYSGQKQISTYCSELVWALLALRDIDPSVLKSQYPEGTEDDLGPWLKSRINRLFSPLPGITSTTTSSPGLVQGPDLQMRNLLGDQYLKRRNYLRDHVFRKWPETNPAKIPISSGHAAAALGFQQHKLPSLRNFYGPDKENSSKIPFINLGVVPNYSPTAFFVLANLPDENRPFSYVATVSFLPERQ